MIPNDAEVLSIILVMILCFYLFIVFDFVFSVLTFLLTL